MCFMKVACEFFAVEVWNLFWEKLKQSSIAIYQPSYDVSVGT